MSPFHETMSMLFILSEATDLLESSTELIRTLEQLNMSLREGKSLDVSLRTLEAIAGLKTQLKKKKKKLLFHPRLGS